MLSEEVQDELMVMESILEEAWLTKNDQEYVFIMKFNDKLQYQPQIRFVLPESYPSVSPIIHIEKLFWLDSKLKSQLMSNMVDINDANIGSGVLYMLVECVQDFFNESADVQNCLESHLAGASKGNHDTSQNDDQYSENNLNSSSITASSDGQGSIKVISGTPFTVNHSCFQAHVAYVTDPKQVSLVLNQLLQISKIAKATHNMYAYRIIKPDGKTVAADCDDDGEAKAGSRLAHLLHVQKVENVVVIVSRWFGGVLLGPERFKHINNVARELLIREGFVTENNSNNSNSSNSSNSKLNNKNKKK